MRLIKTKHLYFIAQLITIGFIHTTIHGGEFAGGTGDPNDPYQIATAQHLLALNERFDLHDKHFILTSDIDLASQRADKSAFDTAIIRMKSTECTHPPRRTPPNTTITCDVPFNGSFNGQHHRIYNLVIEHKPKQHNSPLNPYPQFPPELPFIGLFDRLGNKAQISNLIIEEANIRSLDGRIGILAGINEGGTILNCHVSGTINDHNFGGRVGHDKGGLIGYNQGIIRSCSSTITIDTYSSTVGGLTGINTGVIIASYSKGTINAGNAAGGLVSYNSGCITLSNSLVNVTGKNRVGGFVGDSSGKITACYSTGSAQGTDKVGGFIGDSSYSTITTCYSTGTVSGNRMIGGFAGASLRGDQIDSCYSTGTVFGTHLVGGFIGFEIESLITNSYWDIETSGLSDSAAGTGLSTAQLQDKNTLIAEGWDFTEEDNNSYHNTWKLSSPSSYPRLWWE